jgi:hypothetical protein
MMRDIAERDWKILRELSPIALERFCDRVIDEMQRIGSTRSRTARDRYAELYELIVERDKELGRTFDDLRRSTALLQLTSIHSMGLLMDDEFNRFSEETRDRVTTILGRPKR